MSQMIKPLNRIVGHYVLPAQRLYNANVVNKAHKEYIRDLNKEDFLVETKIFQLSNSTIDSVFVQQRQTSKQWVVYCRGNRGLMEFAREEMISDAKQTGANFVGFNYRGVGRSQGKPSHIKDLVADATHVVDTLINGYGVKPENIILKGHSLGGGVATLTALQFHQRGQRVYLWNDRSFSNISYVVAAWLTPIAALQQLRPWVERALYVFLTSFGWSIPASDAYNALPKTHKQCVVTPQDEIIASDASLAAQVKDTATVSEYVTAETATKGPHFVAPSDLVCAQSSGQTASSRFWQFAKRTLEQSCVTPQAQIGV